MEVTRTPDHISNLDPRPINHYLALDYFFYACLSLELCFCLFQFWSYIALVAVCIFGLAILSCSHWAKRVEWRKISFKSSRLARFVASFSHIDTLVLDNFRVGENSWKSRRAMYVVRKALKHVRVDRLDIREHYLNIHFQ